MDILKQPIVVKATRAVTALFAVISLIAAIVTIVSLTITLNPTSSSLDYTIVTDGLLDGGALARTMAILGFVFSLGLLWLSYQNKDNFSISLIGAGVSLVHFVMGLILSPICSLTGMATLKEEPDYLIPILIIFIVMSVLLATCNVFGMLVKNFKFPAPQSAQQPNMMGQQPYMQPNMMGQPQMQQPYPQQYQQPVPQPQQMQQPYPQSVPQPTQPQQMQQPYQQPAPQQPQQYQQPNDFNHQ